MSEFQDRFLTCTVCGNQFVFTAGEQLFFSEKQFTNDPKRCKGCQAQRLAAVAAKAGIQAIKLKCSTIQTEVQCATCGILTSVPFKPAQNRPVFCRACFNAVSRSPQNTAASAASAPQPPVESLRPRGTRVTGAALPRAATCVGLEGGNA
jgi:CxxC-x17-CxxC domain-containing protein